MSSTDVAVPFTDAVEDGEVLRPSQRRRVEALQVAKEVLVSKAGIFGGSKVEESRAVDDLIRLAEWVIGDEPDPIERIVSGLALRLPGDFAPIPDPRPEFQETMNRSTERMADALTVERHPDIEADADHRAARSDMNDGN